MTTAIRHTNRIAGRNHRKAKHAEVADEAHGLIDRLSHSAVGEEAKELIASLREKLVYLKENAEVAQEQIEAGFHATEKQIKAHPWRAVGITAGVGVLIGLLLGRRHARE